MLIQIDSDQWDILAEALDADRESTMYDPEQRAQIDAAFKSIKLYETRKVTSQVTNCLRVRVASESDDQDSTEFVIVELQIGYSKFWLHKEPLTDPFDDGYRLENEMIEEIIARAEFWAAELDLLCYTMSDVKELLAEGQEDLWETKE